MGCNYYVQTRKPKTYSSCNHTEEEEMFHIGKSSYGWVFSLHVTDKIGTWDKMQEFIYDKQIVDEYDRPIGFLEFKEIVLGRARDEEKVELFGSKDCFFDNETYLMRHVADGIHCVFNHHLTLDYIRGDFS